MIPSLAHFDRWWGDYGVICYAGSTTKSTTYKIVFADWFFNVFRSCTIGFGTPGKMQYEIDFTKNSVVLYEIINGEREDYNKIQAPTYQEFTVIEDGKYYTKQKKYDYGQGKKLTGVEFENPFGSGAKQAWLF